MNFVQSYIDRQYGNYRWKCYDTAINKLRCSQDDEYTGITREIDVVRDQIDDPPILACRFAQKAGYEHLLALANEEGQIAIHNTDLFTNDETPKRFGINAHYNAIFDLSWMFGQMKLVSVSGDHTARLFDIGKGEILQERIFQGHSRSVKTVAFRKQDTAVFATGSRDGAIFIWDTRATVNNHYFTNPDTVIPNSHNKTSTPNSKSKKKFYSNTCVSAANSVTSIVFQDDNTLISCGAGDGNIKIWDLRKNYLVYKHEPVPKYVIPYNGNTTKSGFSNLVIDNSGVKLYANCMDNIIYCYNISTYNPLPVMMYQGHQNCTFYVKSTLSADGCYLLSGSSDNAAYIWNTNKSTPLVSLRGHTAEVTCVAWCQKDIKLVTCSDDMKQKIWRVHDETKYDNWHIEGRGMSVPHVNKQDTKIYTTPSRKRVSSGTPHTQRKKFKVCEHCENLTPGSFERLRCQNCVPTYSSKRKSLQANLSPPDENACKKPCGEKTPRRLFSTMFDSGSKEELAAILEETSPQKSSILSPTANLPNYVIDGEAPHLKNFSPRKKVDKDWLTKMRIEQALRTHLEVISSPTSPKQPRLDSLGYVSPRANNSAKKQRQTTPTNSRAQSPLLKFFRVTNNPSRSCEHYCSSLSSVNSSVPSEIRHVN